ncbi:class 1b ribonucleoside-diphosphate reductase subunit alpha (plasmid) [Niallia taxi]|uniref:class 1b ribonucleoside-diphosphate reductase subunit alpha n=1 Tax=Niallia taxi TaxID=2499688 RepID=UPI0015F73536|nr:class 1b ribonucleoside-diphosphate reductase subunit alpha [Niallia taxi]MED4039859.1 class 1b ribonucleoside-diphosphate reductase subunit alpha [Niallia taxi]MED4056076.1 class 1b ribonucleoside-diphosphate reductase subunit alpha [Niallia taxi]MED4120886.1 class 1b ribonucleoside-diphosphate reductase subunit alpha [Niallia taxi]
MRHIELNNEVTQLNEKGFFRLEKDKEAVAEFLVSEIEPKLIRFESVAQKFTYMVEKDFYYPQVLDQYSIADIEDITNAVYNYEFKFQSYMAISKFYKDYALKTDDKKNYLETYEDRIIIVALFLGQGDAAKAKKTAIAMIEQRYQPATPTFLNAGRSRRGEMVSCFLLEMDDSLNSIFHNINTSGQLSKIGGGVALNLSKLRARNEQIKGIDNAASGVVPVMKLLEDTFSYANQLGQRKGAGAAYLNIFHWDVVEFLDTKKINADEKSRIQTLSIGLIVENKFFQLAKENKDFYVFAPFSVFKEYGVHLDDMRMDEMYDELVANPNVKKRVAMTAREMITKIAQIQLESGYPYFMNKSNANKAHALKDIGQIKMSNLCTEIFQLQETSEITDYGQEDIIRRDINCNLGSLNIPNVMQPGDVFRDSVHVGIEALTTVSDISDVQNAPSVKKANEELHAIGLGAMNLHGYLSKNRISYESDEARDFTATFFMMMNYYSIEKSMMIAKERNETFKDFDKSEYAKGTYFAKYKEVSYAPKTDKAKQLFEGIYIPTCEDWTELAALVQEYGMYNAYRLAVAPTQSIGYIQNATASVMPVVNQIESRTYANSTTYYPMPYMDETNFWFYKSAFDMNQFKVMDLIAAAQEHVDQGISTILYVNSDVSTKELARYYIYANEIGLKSLYYTRTRNLAIDECIACAV